MKKLFLSSFFSDVAPLFANFAKEDINEKTITFIPTASIPEKVYFYVDSDKNALQKLGLVVDELEISKANKNEIAKKLEENDYIFISGGNTFFLLQELKKTGADKIITEQINAGKIYIGSSAGSVVLSPNIEYIKYMDDTNAAPDLNNGYTALSIIDFYPCPHYKGETHKKSVEKIISEYENKLKLFPISNSQTINVIGNRIDIETFDKVVKK